MNVNEMLDSAYEGARIAQMNADTAREAIRQRDILLDALRECAAWFADRADVQDGSYGVPAANEEMRMQMLCDEATTKCGF